MHVLGRSSRIIRARIFKTGQTTVYATGDDGTYQIGEDHNYEALTTGQYSGTTAITLNGKTETKSNACVMDHASGLMWARTVSASVGPTSNGLLPWTTNVNGEGIFTYAAAANAALLAGYGNDPDPKKNWHVPNCFELYMLAKLEAGGVDTSAFPSWPSAIWTSTTRPITTTQALSSIFAQGTMTTGNLKTVPQICALVRGPL